ncbi:hypothetical protein [Hyphomonas sp.]|uniref:hypothetical protein n=1 Tax=Hyphomonas sp. TaxID=87 RepID=UPI0032662724
MPYKITFQPISKIAGVRPKTVERDSAKEAWKLVYGLMQSDERVEILSPSGWPMDWQELKRVASEEDE